MKSKILNSKFLILNFVALATCAVFAQDAIPASVPALQAASTGFAWFLENLKAFGAIAAAIVVTARLIVKLTPTQTDDNILSKIVEFLKHVGLHIE